VSTPTDNDLGSIFKAATQSVIGGLFVWSLTCSFAGIVAGAATIGHLQDLSWEWIFAGAFSWIIHLAIASIGLWGLLVIFIHALCLSALINETEHVLRVLIFAFAIQLTTSMIVIVILERHALLQAIAIWLPITTICAIYLIRKSVETNRE